MTWLIQNKVYGLLGLAMKAGKITFGTDSCLENIESKKIKLILIAEDASERNKRHFLEKCKTNAIPYYIFGDTEHLSSAIGKSNKTVIGIQDKNLAGAIQKVLNGGDVIG